jgi:hypothetical protein
MPSTDTTMRIQLHPGTAGRSASFSDHLGECRVHPNSHSGRHLAARVWSLASHAGDTTPPRGSAPDSPKA